MEGRLEVQQVPEKDSLAPDAAPPAQTPLALLKERVEGYRDDPSLTDAQRQEAVQLAFKTYESSIRAQANRPESGLQSVGSAIGAGLLAAAEDPDNPKIVPKIHVASLSRFTGMAIDVGAWMNVVRKVAREQRLTTFFRVSLARIVSQAQAMADGIAGGKGQLQISFRNLGLLGWAGRDTARKIVRGLEKLNLLAVERTTRTIGRNSFRDDNAYFLRLPEELAIAGPEPAPEPPQRTAVERTLDTLKYLLPYFPGLGIREFGLQPVAAAGPDPRRVAHLPAQERADLAPPSSRRQDKLPPS